MADWNDPATWDYAYNFTGGRPNKQDTILPVGAGYGEDLNYLSGRKFVLQRDDDGEPGLAGFRFTLQKLGASGFSPASETLIVGCGYGWLLEAIINLGSNAVWGTDTSTLIHSTIANPDVSVRSDVQQLVFNINILDPDAASQFQAVGAGTNQGLFRNIVTEHLLEDWPISTIGDILDACDALRAQGQSNVYHYVLAQDKIRPNASDPVIVPNLLTLAEWSALRPAHFWVDSATGNVAGGQ